MGYGMNEILAPAENRTPSVVQPVACRYTDWGVCPPEVKVINVNDTVAIHGLNWTESLFWILVDGVFAHQKHIGLTVTYKVMKQNN
jgi:hypothetical protein